MTSVVHIFDVFGDGGTQFGIRTLVERGFYDGMRLHVVGIARGSGKVYDDFVRLLGPGNTVVLLDQPTFKRKNHIDICRKLSRLFGEVGADVVISSSPTADFLARVTALFHPGIKYITFEHADQRFKPRHEWLQFRPTSPRCDGVFGDNAVTLQGMRRLYVLKRPEFCVPVTLLRPGTPRSAERPDHFRLLSLGRLDQQKNYLELIRAVALLLQEGYSLDLTIAGNGIEQAATEDLVRDLKLVDRVHLPGFIHDPAKLAELRRQSHIYIQPSRFEGFPLAVAEAMAAGMVVIASDVGGIRTYCTDGVDMLKINKPDPADAMKSVPAADIANVLRRAMQQYDRIAAPLSSAAIATSQKYFGETAVKQQWDKARAFLMAPRS